MSSDPKRLFEDPATSADVRDDLVRSIATPLREYDMERGLSRFLSVTAVGAATASVVSSTKAATVASSTKAAWLAWLVKWGFWGGAAIVATGVSGHFILAQSHRSDPIQNTVSTVKPTATQAPAGSGDVASVAPAPPTVAADSPVVDLPLAVPSQTAVSPRPGRGVQPRLRVGSPGSVAQMSDESVAREVALLGRARAALTSDPAQALVLTQEGQRDFPRGVLGEEREAIAVLALVRLARPAEAAARGQAFLTRYPDGPFTERVRLALGASNPGTPR